MNVDDFFKKLELKPGTFNIVFVDPEVIGREVFELLAEHLPVGEVADCVFVAVRSQKKVSDALHFLSFETIETLEKYVKSLRKVQGTVQ